MVVIEDSMKSLNILNINVVNMMYMMNINGMHSKVKPAVKFLKG